MKRGNKVYRKQIGTLLLAATMTAAAMLTGCQGTTKADTTAAEQTGTSAAQAESSGEDKLVVYFSSGMAGGAAWGQAEKGFNDACAELGWEGHYLAPQTPGNTQDMVNNTETALTNGADIILIVLTQEDATEDVMNRAVEQGVTLIGIATDNDIPAAYIGTDPVNLGYSVAEALIQAMGDKPIKVLTMQSNLTIEQQNDQVAAFEEKLKELRPDAIVADKTECMSNAATAQDKISASYLADPDINCMVSFDSYAGLGGAAFVQENGLQDSFCVVGIDDAPEILRCVQDGSMVCTVAQHWYNVGYDGAYLAKAVRDGGQYERGNDSGTTTLFIDDIDGWVKERGIDMGE